ncbi:MAG: hypothetical protein K5931_06805 [Lachnospiraceae bacterium]|nr:hypothetical protein [Lachnospiraceae bacterium]
MKILIKQMLQWMAAITAALFIMNLFCFIYYSPFLELKREHGANTGFLLPGMRGVYGMEGYCMAGSDKRGYVNRDLPLEKDYYLVAGASHSEGLFLPVEDRFSDVLNEKLKEGEGLKVYNIARSGNFFSVVTQHFDGILGEFPDAKGIIIETDSLSYDTKAWRDSMIQVGYDEGESIEAIMSGMSSMDKLKLNIKRCLPLVRELHKQFLTMQSSSGELRESDVYKGDFDEEYKRALNELLAFLRSRTDKELIIVFHPAVSIEESGDMKLLSTGAEELFGEACRANDIEFIDMSERFLEAYEEEHIVPMGFSNTTMASGHTNKAAHRMMAEEIYKVIRSEKESDQP